MLTQLGSIMGSGGLVVLDDLSGGFDAHALLGTAQAFGRGGSWYYLPAGLAVMTSGGLLLRARRSALAV